MSRRVACARELRAGAAMPRNSISRLRCGLRLRPAAVLGNDSSSANNSISSFRRVPGVSNSRSLLSFCSTASSRAKPAACSSWVMNGWSALF
jgi:hypothetical protein